MSGVGPDGLAPMCAWPRSQASRVGSWLGSMRCHTSILWKAVHRSTMRFSKLTFPVLDCTRPLMSCLGSCRLSHSITSVAFAVFGKFTVPGVVRNVAYSAHAQHLLLTELTLLPPHRHFDVQRHRG